MEKEEFESLYKETMDEIATPAGLEQKLMSIPENPETELSAADAKRRSGHVWRSIAVVAAALAVVFGLSNAVTYAATGTSWVKRLWGSSYDRMKTDMLETNGTIYIYQAIPLLKADGTEAYDQFAYSVDENGIRSHRWGMAWIMIGDSSETGSPDLPPEGIATEVPADSLGKITAECMKRNISTEANGLFEWEEAEIYLDGEKLEILEATGPERGMLYHVAAYDRGDEHYLITVRFEGDEPIIRAFKSEIENKLE